VFLEGDHGWLVVLVIWVRVLGKRLSNQRRKKIKDKQFFFLKKKKKQKMDIVL
jgi:hypothetical protein